MTTILDNLAWVVSVRERIGAQSRRVGFDRLVIPSNDFPPTRASDKVAELADHVHPVRRALALRAIRNATDHGTGLTQGWAMSVQGKSRWGPEMLAVWVPRRGLLYRLPKGESEAANELLDVATFAIDDLLLLRPRVLIEAALVCAADLTSRLLRLYEWNSGAWLHQDATSRRDLQVLRLSRGRWHRGLWGWDLLPEALRARNWDDGGERN
jgi:hypothetical protein